MSAVLTAIAAVVALPAALSLLVFTAEIAAGFARARPAPATGAAAVPAVLIPAHNEAAGIGATIATVRAGRPDLRVLVVADNCTDDTAAVARAAGAAVVERHDPTRRGKGYALAFGRDALAADPPDCVVVLDADCAMAGEDVMALAAAAVASGRAVQSRNLQRPRRDLPPTAALSDFAFLVKNLVRQQGSSRLGGVAMLTGTGMAIPWADFAAAPLATSDLAEDLALGVWLTRRGRPPRYLAVATVWSDAVSGADLLAQRRRWEGGFIATARRRALPLLIEGIRRGSRATLWLGLHLLVPPLALLAMVAVAALLVTIGLAVAGAGWWVPALLAVLLGLAGLAVVAAWARYGRDQIGARALLGIPAYMLGKLPLYRSIARGKAGEWRRTRRAGEE